MTEERSETEKMLADTLAFVWRVPILRQFTITGTTIALGYGFGWLVADGGLQRVASDVRDLVRSRRGDTEAEGRVAGRFAGDFLSALGFGSRAR